MGVTLMLAFSFIHMCFANLITITFSLGDHANALAISDILKNKYSYPQEIIMMHQKTNPCENSYSNKVLHICVDKGEMKLISIKENILRKSFKIFSANKYVN